MMLQNSIRNESIVRSLRETGVILAVLWVKARHTEPLETALSYLR